MSHWSLDSAAWTATAYITPGTSEYVQGVEVAVTYDMGKQQPDLVGVDVTDQTGNAHLGIVDIPIPILKGNAQLIKKIREKLYATELKKIRLWKQKFPKP